MAGENNNKFEEFLKLHKPQLQQSGIPEILWENLHKKLQNEIFDAGEVFGIVQVEGEDEEEEETEWAVVVTKEEGVTSKDPQHVYLIDHAWTYQVSHARGQLDAMPQLCERMARLMDVHTDGQTNAQLADAVLQHMWKYNQTYQFAGLAKDEDASLEPLWYVMDEFGSRIQHSDEPSVKVVPFHYAPNKTTFSVMWLLHDLDFQDEVTRDYVVAVSDDLQRKNKLLPWIEQDCTDFPWTQDEVDASYFKKYSTGETWPPELGAAFVVLDKSKTIKVYSDMAQVVNNLSLKNFEITSDKSQADIWWLYEHFKDYRNLYCRESTTFINQFPNEMLLTVKDPLAIVSRRAGDDNKQQVNSEGLETRPKWLPTTYNLQTEMPQFVSYFQNRDKRELDNHWILKPWNMARGLDMHITNDVNKIIRLSEGGPKVACKYIEDPVLFHRPEVGHVKYDIRYIVMLASARPLKLYVYRVFWLRFANKPYDLSNLDDYEKHFTVMNYANPDKLKQVHYDEYIKLFEQQYPDFVWQHVELDIFEMFKELFSAAVSRDAPAGLPSSPCSRAIYAIDLMLKWHTNQTGMRVIQPMLCEVNYSPDCERACKYHPDFYNDVFSALFLDDIADRPVTQIL